MVVTQSLNAFGLSASNAEFVSDILANTASRTQTTVSDLGTSLRTSAAAANIFGVEFNEAAAALGILAQAGLGGSLGGTAFRGFLVSASQLGIDTSRGLVEAVRELEDLQLSQSELVQAFGREYFQAAQILLDNVDALELLNDQNREAQGTSSRLAEIVQNNLTGSFNRLKSALDELSIAIVENNLDILRDTVDRFKPRSPLLSR